MAATRRILRTLRLFMVSKFEQCLAVRGWAPFRAHLRIYRIKMAIGVEMRIRLFGALAVSMVAASPAHAMCVNPPGVGQDPAITARYLTEKSDFTGFVVRLNDVVKDGALRQHLLIVRSFKGPSEGTVLLAPYGDEAGHVLAGSSLPMVNMLIGATGLVSLTLTTEGFSSNECFDRALSKIDRPTLAMELLKSLPASPS